MTPTLKFVRKYKTGSDAISHDHRQDHSQWAIYTFTWDTGTEVLVFFSEADARRFAELEEAEFEGPKGDQA